MALPPRVAIDGTEYETEKLSEEARTLLDNIRFVDSEIARLRQQQGVNQTARNVYTTRLMEVLQKEGGAAVASVPVADDDVYPGEEEE